MLALSQCVRSSLSLELSYFSLAFCTSQALTAVVLIWLWNNHEQDFQRAFATSDRVDFDATCKWLVHSALDTSVQALKQYMEGLTGMAGGSSNSRLEGLSEASMPSDIATVLVASRALTAESCIDEQTVSVAVAPFDADFQYSETHPASNLPHDYALSHFHALTRFLDDFAVCAHLKDTVSGTDALGELDIVDVRVVCPCLC